MLILQKGICYDIKRNRPGSGCIHFHRFPRYQQQGDKCASQEVRDRIWEIVRRTGYSPNTAARNLKTGQNSEHASPRSRSIACIFARTQEPMKDAFFSTLARGIEQEAFKHNYVCKIHYYLFGDQ